MQLGSMFISNCNNTLHVSDAFCVHPQEYLKTVVAANGVRHETGWNIQYWRPRSMASALSHIVFRKPTTLDAHIGYFTPSHVIHQRLLLQFLSTPEDGRRKRPKHVEYLLQLLINILPSCITLVLYIHSNNKFHENPSKESRAVPCGRTDRHDETNISFSQFCGHAEKSLAG
jgi:hypothetical protein